MKLDGKLWIDVNGLGIAGHGRIKLLELVNECGSIKKAAETMKMSYKAAWDSINSLNEIYGKPLVERQTGGKGGGGTTLTKTGKDLIKAYNHFSRIHMMYLNAMSDSNKVNCTVQSVTDTHAIALTSAGDEIACTMLDTDLKKGDAVTLFIGPKDVILMDSDNFATSARNVIKAQVVKVVKKGTNSEISLKTAKGTPLDVSITAQSCERLGLVPGKEIFALFKTASALIMR